MSKFQEYSLPRLLVEEISKKQEKKIHDSLGCQPGRKNRQLVLDHNFKTKGDYENAKIGGGPYQQMK